MEWAQCFTILGGTAAIVIPLIIMIRNDMKTMEARWEANRRESDQKWTTLFGLYIEQIRNK